VGVEEQRIRAPREWLESTIEIVVRWCLRQFTTMFFLEMFYMLGVFGFNFDGPGQAYSDSWNADIIADFAPEISCSNCMVLNSLELGEKRAGCCCRN